MKRFPTAFLLLAAGCGVSDPREDAVLFDSSEERMRRDLFAFYYSEFGHGAVLSVVVPRQGAAESRGDLGPGLRKFPSLVSAAGVRTRWRTEQIPVDDTHREAIEGIFAGLPAGASERTLLVQEKSEQDGFERERASPPLTRVRILHVSRAGELKTLTVFKGVQKDLPAAVPAGGATLGTLDEMFLRFARHNLQFR